MRGRTLVVALVTVAAACTGAGRSTEPPPSRGPLGGTLRIGMATPAFFTMDPRDEWNSATWELFRCCLVRTLMSYDVSETSPSPLPVPDLAAAPPTISPDGLTWTFHLRRGVHYAPPLADVEVTSPDFVRALLRAADPALPAEGLPSYFRLIEGWEAYAAGEASSIVGLRTPDPFTLTIVTNRADASLLNLLALPLAAPIPPMPGDPDAPLGVATGFDPEGESYGRYLVSSGPYMFEGAEAIDFTEPLATRKPASGFDPWVVIGLDEGAIDHYGRITLVRNPSWRPDQDPLRLALADRIELVGGPSPSLFGQMEAGTLDLVFDDTPPGDLLRRYQADPELRSLIQTPSGAGALDYAVFNVAVPPFDDPAVRRAVATAMDRAAFTDARRDLGDYGARLAEHFSSDTFEASLLAGWSGLPGDGHGDLAAAREALRDSPYAKDGRCADPVCDGVTVVVHDLMPSAAPSLRRALAALGIDADIQIDNPFICMDPESHVGMCAGLGWAPDYPSADGYLRPFFYSQSVFPVTRLGASPTDLRRWGYTVRHVPSVDDRIDRCARDTTSTQAACWARLDQYFVTQLVAAVPLSFLDVLRVSSPRLGPFPWDQINQEPALERIPAPA